MQTQQPSSRSTLYSPCLCSLFIMFKPCQICQFTVSSRAWYVQRIGLFLSEHVNRKMHVLNPDTRQTQFLNRKHEKFQKDREKSTHKNMHVNHREMKAFTCMNNHEAKVLACFKLSMNSNMKNKLFTQNAM